MKRDMRVYLQDILESVERIQRYTRGFDKARFLDDTAVQDAVIRRLEVMGEAVKNLPADFRAAHPEVRWADIAGMRDVLIHGYAGVSLEVVWRAVERDIPAVKPHIERLLKSVA